MHAYINLILPIRSVLYVIYIDHVDVFCAMVDPLPRPLLGGLLSALRKAW